MLQKNLKPNLPEDVAISFYIQSHKLVFAVYHLTTVHGNVKFDCHQADASIPWLNEVLVLFTVALQLCQQLKDKVGATTQCVWIGSFLENSGLLRKSFSIKFIIGGFSNFD